MTKIFISYARDDGSQIAEHLFRRLEDAGYQTLKDDKTFKPGSRFSAEIIDNIKSCDIFLALMTPGALKSNWVENEVLAAQKNNKNVIPVFTHEPSDSPIYLQGITQEKMYEGVQDWQALHNLVNRLPGGRDIPRAINISGHTGIKAKGILILDELDFQKADLNTRQSIEEIAIYIAKHITPIIKETNAGIVPHGYSPIASSVLAYLLGVRNNMPKIYWTNRLEDDSFQISDSAYIALQEMREKGFSYR